MGGLLGIAIPVLFSSIAIAGQIPAGWSCSGNCGTLGADGVVTAPPYGLTYAWVSTYDSTATGQLPGVGGAGATNGSTLLSPLFSANANDSLKFYFNYVTSDGTPDYPDYGWARLLNSSMEQTAILFTARTVPSPGNIVPGNGMPPPEATLNPGAIPIQEGTTWSPLGGSSGECFMGVGQGCGNSGWVSATYGIRATGNYYLQIGVTNWGDTLYDSGLAVANVSINNVDISQGNVPEPSTFLLVLAGIGALAVRRYAFLLS